MPDDDLTPLDLEILDGLSNFYESIETLHQWITTVAEPPFPCTQHEILDRLQFLHEHTYVFLILNKTFDHALLLDEVEERTDSRAYWFGRTEKGYKAWTALTPQDQPANG